MTGDPNGLADQIERAMVRVLVHTGWLFRAGRKLDEYEALLAGSCGGLTRHAAAVRAKLEEEYGHPVDSQTAALACFTLPRPQAAQPIDWSLEDVGLDPGRDASQIKYGRTIETLDVYRLAPPRLAAAFSRCAKAIGVEPPSTEDVIAITRFEHALLRTTPPPPPSRLAPTLRALSDADVARLVEFALELGPLRLPWDEAPGQLIAQIACTGYERLTDHYPRLYDSGLDIPAVAFFDVDEAMCRRIIADSKRPHRGDMLMWIADDTVSEALVQGEIEHTIILSFPHLDQSGHEFLADGAIVQLYLDDSFELVPAASPEAAASAPIRAMVPGEGGEEPDVWLFDIDLTDELAAAVEFDGTRLRIPFVHSGGPFFWRLDGAGGAEFLGDASEGQIRRVESPPVVLVAGAERGTPFETVGGVHIEPCSQFGGSPAWEQWADYPECADCGEHMTCIGQIDLSKHHGLEGRIYAFVCGDCEIAATCVQVD